MTSLDPDEATRLARSLSELLHATQQGLLAAGDSALTAHIVEHIGCPLGDVPNVTTNFAAWELANLQRGVDAYLSARSPHAQWFGIAGSGRYHQDLVDMLSHSDHYGGYRLGAVDYTTVATGPDSTTEAVQLGLVRSVAPDGQPVVIAMRGQPVHPGDGGCSLRVLAASRQTATAVHAEVERLMRIHDVFRGQVLSFDMSEYRGNEMVSFLPRPRLSPDDVVLPDGVLATIERHVVRPTAVSELLSQHGQHLKRGLLLHGAPGTGKTHTVRYLLGRLTEATVVVVSGRAMHLLPAAVTMARRLTPSVVVFEDVDLVAEDRAYSHGPQPLLFELLNRIDGVDADVDVTFVLTTNRVETLERALVDRPGRIDLAVEVPRPDAAGREKLLRLYAREVTLDLPDASRLVAATDGATASFMRELVRRAVLRQLDTTPPHARVNLDETVLQAALDELSGERQALTRNLLGATDPHRP
ncbi:MAG: ATP-binding protein [Actinomycetota bacterium]|nr:ATP-binding protein [Actinomycetota bacterium]